MLWFSGISIFKKTSKWDPPACSWGKHLPDHRALLPRSSAGAWLIQGSSAALLIFLLSLEISDFLQGCWESETQENCYQGFLGDWINFACYYLKYTTKSSFSIETGAFLLRVGLSLSEDCCQPCAFISLWSCSLVGPNGRTGLERLFTAAVCLSMSWGPCENGALASDHCSLGFSFLFDLGRLKWYCFWVCSSVLTSPPSSASLWNSDAGMRLPSSS